MPVNFQGTLTITTTPTSLHTLMVAARGVNVPRICSILRVQGDDGNAAPIYQGDSNVSATVFANVIQNAGDFINIGQGLGNNIPTTDKYFMVAAGEEVIHVACLLY
jgi:hypothetical protein